MATSEDIDAILAVHTASIRELCSSHYSQEQINAWVGAIESKRYKDILSDDNKIMLVAEENDTIIGAGMADANSAELKLLYVDPKHVQDHVGSWLLAKLEDLVVDRGVRVMSLCSSLNAVEFYQQAGYDVQGDVVHELPGGLELACVQMEKVLI